MCGQEESLPGGSGTRVDPPGESNGRCRPGQGPDEGVVGAPEARGAFWVAGRCLGDEAGRGGLAPLAVRMRSVVHVDGRWDPLSILARDRVLLQSSLTPTSHLTPDRLEASASPWHLGKGRAKSKKASLRRHPET